MLVLLGNNEKFPKVFTRYFGCGKGYTGAFITDSNTDAYSQISTIDRCEEIHDDCSFFIFLTNRDHRCRENVVDVLHLQQSCTYPTCVDILSQIWSIHDRSRFYNQVPHWFRHRAKLPSLGTLLKFHRSLSFIISDSLEFLQNPRNWAATFGHSVHHDDYY